MKSEFQIRGYEVHLPIAVQVPNQTLAHGVTECISSQNIRFTVNSSLPIKQGGPVALRVSLPEEITNGNTIQLRVSGTVVRMERDAEPNAGRMNVVATLDWYDFVRTDTTNERFAGSQRKRAANY
jgi:hypothetical protein